MGRFWRLYGKIVEDILEDSGGYIKKLRRLYGENVKENPLTPWDPVGLPLEPLEP